MKKPIKSLLLSISGFVAGMIFVVSCGGGSSSLAQDMTGVEQRLDQLITINTDILSRLGGATNPTNTPPVADVSGSPTNVTTGVLIQVDGSASSDADGDNLNFAWKFEDIPAGSFVQLNNSAVIRPSFTPDVDGDYVLRLDVTDTSGATSSAYLTIISTP